MRIADARESGGGFFGNHCQLPMIVSQQALGILRPAMEMKISHGLSSYAVVLRPHPVAQPFDIEARGTPDSQVFSPLLSFLIRITLPIAAALARSGPVRDGNVDQRKRQQ
jgi:hypothetical protein